MPIPARVDSEKQLKASRLPVPGHGISQQAVPALSLVAAPDLASLPSAPMLNDRVNPVHGEVSPSPIGIPQPVHPIAAPAVPALAAAPISVASINQEADFKLPVLLRVSTTRSIEYDLKLLSIRKGIEEFNKKPAIKILLEIRGFIVDYQKDKSASNSYIDDKLEEIFLKIDKQLVVKSRVGTGVSAHLPGEMSYGDIAFHKKTGKTLKAATRLIKENLKIINRTKSAESALLILSGLLDIGTKLGALFIPIPGAVVASTALTHHPLTSITSATGIGNLITLNPVLPYLGVKAGNKVADLGATIVSPTVVSPMNQNLLRKEQGMTTLGALKIKVWDNTEKTGPKVLRIVKEVTLISAATKIYDGIKTGMSTEESWVTLRKKFINCCEEVEKDMISALKRIDPQLLKTKVTTANSLNPFAHKITPLAGIISDFYEKLSEFKGSVSKFESAHPVENRNGNPSSGPVFMTPEEAVI